MTVHDRAAKTYKTLNDAGRSPDECLREAVDSAMAPLRDALLHATAALAAAASAYAKYACRHRSVGRGQTDPFFTTRVIDFRKAEERARAAVRALSDGGIDV